MNKKNTVTRRKVIGGIGAGLAAMAINPVFAGPTKAFSASSSSPDLDLEDPTSKYPKPPFNPQSQPWPGLAGKMDPTA